MNSNEEVIRKRNENLAKARAMAAEIRKKKLDEKIAQQAIQDQIKKQLAETAPPSNMEEGAGGAIAPPPELKEKVLTQETAKTESLREPKKKKKIIVYQDTSDSEEEQIIIRKNKKKEVKDNQRIGNQENFIDPTTQHLENEMLKRQYALKLETLRMEQLKNFLCPPSNWKR